MAAVGVPQTASGVVNLASREGVEGLQRRLGCSRRQAEQALVLAQRALATGDVLSPDDIPVNTAAVAQRRQAAVPAPDPVKVDLDTEARNRAAKIRALPPSERTRTLGELEAQMATMRRNLDNGHPEWAGQLAHLQRIRDLAQGVAW